MSSQSSASHRICQRQNMSRRLTQTTTIHGLHGLRQCQEMSMLTVHGRPPSGNASNVPLRSLPGQCSHVLQDLLSCLRILVRIQSQTAQRMRRTFVRCDRGVRSLEHFNSSAESRHQVGCGDYRPTPVCTTSSVTHESFGNRTHSLLPQMFILQCG